MLAICWVGLGGALGAMLRFSVSLAMTPYLKDASYPLATLCINWLGCLLAGLFLGLAQPHWSPSIKLFMVTGLLGGFTTFSAFGMETVGFIERGQLLMAVCYMLLSVIGGISLVGLGIALSQWIN